MLFYIDTADGSSFIHDDEGMEFSDLNEACAATVALLPEIARDVLHATCRRSVVMQAQERSISAQVRDAAGQVVFRTQMRFDMEWPAPHKS